MAWLLLVVSLSGSRGALRLRLWRSVKALGAVALRDGVYVAPATEAMTAAFRALSAEVIAAEGTAFDFTLSDNDAEKRETLTMLFDRVAQYEAVVADIAAFVNELDGLNESAARRKWRQLSRDLASVESIDFFPGQSRDSANAALNDAHRAIDLKFSPEEPLAVHASIPPSYIADFRDKLWATRSHLWVDRVCSAWLIRRFIDPKARFVWLEHAGDCPSDAIGFDFDGARFSHVEQFVTFEVLAQSFGLDDDVALQRIAALVRYLDVGGRQVPEAAGFEAILTGARARCSGDDELLDDMSRTLDDIYRAFTPG